MKRWICFCLQWTWLYLLGQPGTPLPATPFNFLGAYSNHFVDILSLGTNQASSTNLNGFHAGISSEKRSLLGEINSIRMQLGFTSKAGSLGFALNYFGIEAFSAGKIGLSYGKSLGAVGIAVQFNYYMLRIAGYGNMSQPGFEISLLYKLNEKLMTGLHMRDPVGLKYGRTRDEKLSALFNYGLGYEVSQNVFVGIELIKEEDMPVNIHSGIHYKISGKLLLSMGMMSSPAEPYLVIGWDWGNIRVIASSSYHFQLGPSPGIQLIYFTKEKRK